MSLRQFYARDHGKCSDKWEHYIDYYDELFAPKRNAELDILEIGVQNGGSLEALASYFPNARTITGVDIDRKCGELSFADPRIKVVVGDASHDAVSRIVCEITSSFDLVIDDGSHTSSDVILEFLQYFPRLRDGGIYIAEDLHCSYWREYEGGLFHPHSSIEFFKLLADTINQEHWALDKTKSQLLSGIVQKYGGFVDDSMIDGVFSVEFSNSLCVVRKRKAKDCALGRRIIAGDEALVVPSLKDEFHCRPSDFGQRLPQLNNRWSRRDMPPAQELARRLDEIAALSRKIDRLQRIFLAQEQALTLANRQVGALKSSSSWRLTKPLRTLGRVAPQVRQAMGKFPVLGPQLRRLRRRLLGEVRPYPIAPLSFSERRADGGPGSLALSAISAHDAGQISSYQRHISVMRYRPRFTALIDTRGAGGDLQRTLRSLQDQVYPCDETVLLSDSVPSAHPTAGVEGSAGDAFLIYLKPGDWVEPTALYHFASALNDDCELDVVYADEWRRDPADERRVSTPFFKPAWSPEYLLCMDYIGRAACHRWSRLGPPGAVLPVGYELNLKSTTDGRVRHLRKLSFDTSAASAGDPLGYDDDNAALSALSAHMARRGRTGAVAAHPRHRGCYVRTPTSESGPAISVIIPTAGKVIETPDGKLDLIVNLVAQLRTKTDYDDLEIIVVDNDDLTGEQHTQLESFGCRRISYFEPVFNVAAKLNLGASIASGEYLLLMNDDIELVDEGWLKRLVDVMDDGEVGVVGTRLLYPDRTLQHAGVVHNYGNPDHVRRGREGDEAGYFNSTCGTLNYLAVTGACTLTRSDLYRKVGGYSETLAVSFNDIDYCLKVLEAGYRTAYCGSSALIHMESKSREAYPDRDELEYFYKRWVEYTCIDPFYNDRCLSIAPPTFIPTINLRMM